MLGRFTHSVDTKGRLALPSRFRPFLEDGLVMTKGADRCLFLFPKKAWDALQTKMDQLPILTSAEARSMRRTFFGNASAQMLDTHSRIMIPQELRRFAHIEKEVVGLGLSTYIELWAPEILRQVEGTDDDDLPAPDWSSLGI